GHFVFESFDAHVALCELHHLWVVLDTHGAGTKMFCSRDRNTSIAGPEINHEVVGRDLGCFEHGHDQVLLGRDPDHVLACLTAARREISLTVCSGLGRPAARRGENRQRGNERSNGSVTTMHSEHSCLSACACNDSSEMMVPRSGTGLWVRSACWQRSSAPVMSRVNA